MKLLSVFRFNIVKQLSLRDLHGLITTLIMVNIVGYTSIEVISTIKTSGIIMWVHIN